MKGNEMQKLIVAIIMVLFMAGCSGPYAITGMGSSEGDAGASFGKVVNENVEVGITAISYNMEDNHDTYAVGPYAAYLIPMPDKIKDEWQPLAGGAMLLNMDDGQGEFVPKAFAGVIKDPGNTISLFALAEKSFPSGAINSPDIKARGEDVYGWFGLRYRF